MDGKWKPVPVPWKFYSGEPLFERSRGREAEEEEAFRKGTRAAVAG